MELSGIKTAIITEEAKSRVSKFIVAEISDGRSRKKVLRSSNAGYHKDIAQELLGELDDKLAIAVDGGGRLFFDDKSKKIWIWGESSAYGRADFGEAEKLLKENYKQFSIVREEHDL